MARGASTACSGRPRASPGPWCSWSTASPEYVARYDSFARFLNRQGFLVVGEDHMGHGGSLAPGDPPGYFHGGWNAAVDDTYALLQKTHGECPQLPYVILGHSMGSFLTRTLLYRHPDSGIRAAVICGTAWQPDARPENRAGYVPPRLSKAWRDPGL